MRRKFTVYGLRFSKTSFWNRINTGFTDPAVATALTACGIETRSWTDIWSIKRWALQQRLPLAVLKHLADQKDFKKFLLQQRLPLAVLKLVVIDCHLGPRTQLLQQRLPLAVLKLATDTEMKFRGCCNSAYRLRYWNNCGEQYGLPIFFKLQQRLPLAVLKLSCGRFHPYRFQYRVATALTACGIETLSTNPNNADNNAFVATALTACGIET